MAKSDKRNIRVNFSEFELEGIYAFVGGHIAEIRDRAALNDTRPSEIAGEVALWHATQDRIASVIRAAREDDTEKP